MTEPIIQIEDLTRLNLNPGDVLLVRMNGQWTPDAVAQVRDQLRPEIVKRFPGADIIVASGDIDFAVLARGES